MKFYAEGKMRRGFPLLFIGLLIFIGLENVEGSTISGFVYDSQRNPLSEVNVELLNSDYAIQYRVTTSGDGRYNFENVPDGRHFIRAMAFRTNFEDQTQEVLVETFSLLGGGNGFFTKDFYLKRKRGGLGETTTGVVFVQEVPEVAKDLYERGRDDLQNKRVAEGIKKLIEAIKIFPTYYAASQELGIHLLTTGQYLEAFQLFIRAAESNPKSSKSFYYMGFALSKLGKDYNKSALAALKKAADLAPSSFEVALLFGKIERQDGNYVEAEKHLVRAKKLANAKIPEIHIELAQLYANDLKRYALAADELESYLKASKKKDDIEINKQISKLRKKAKNGN